LIRSRIEERRESAMHRRKAFTLVELLVVIAIILLLIAIMRPARCRPRKVSRRTVCLGNLKQLSLAWVMYADDNDGALVNGESGNWNRLMPNPTPPPTEICVEPPWVSDIALQNGNPMIDKRSQEQKIQDGALWEYLKNPKAFHCPAGKENHSVTYQIVDSMNGFQQPDTVADRVWANNRSDLSKAHNKLVFIDIGEVRSSSYHVSYRAATWLDMPPVRHHDGATVSFADAHVVYWEWKGQDTISFGRNDKRSDGERQPTSPEGNEDLQKMQEAVWGKLGYNPSTVD
jgi:prepilin-type N-terminal cleavage/methylation domain-containing protein